MSELISQATNNAPAAVKKTVFNRYAVGIVSAMSLFGQTNVVTQHNDIGRTGQNLTETILTPANVTSAKFGKLFTLNVDGQVIAQPLYMSSVTIGGAVHHVVFVATEHDSVYAFDASNGTKLWQASMLDPLHGAAAGATPVPASDVIGGCLDISQFPRAAAEWGITSTPVIDASKGVLYVVSKTSEGIPPVQLYRLHALDITTGTEALRRSPVAVSASVAAKTGVVAFDPKFENQRTGLLEINGNIYLAFGSYCDHYKPAGPLNAGELYHGWILGYNATTLQQTAKFITTPNVTLADFQRSHLGSGIWMSGAGLAADALNGLSRIFPVLGNGLYDAPPSNNMDYGDDILRLTVAGDGALTVADQFTPALQNALDVPDRDLGSGGALLLPDQPGPNPHLLVVMGKTDDHTDTNRLYLVNRDNLGGFHQGSGSPPLGFDKIVQKVSTTGNLFGLPAYWNGNLYVWPSGSTLSRYPFTSGRLPDKPSETSTQQQQGNGYSGSTPSISANGTQNGIVWSVDSSLGGIKTGLPGCQEDPPVNQAQPRNVQYQIVYAHDATDVSHMLWSSAQNAAFDSAGCPQKFVVPTIADGHVFIGAGNQVQAYALIPPLSFTVSESHVFFGSYAWTFPISLADLPKATVSVNNSELGPLTAIDLAISGRDRLDFFSYIDDPDCQIPLAPGHGCQISVVFNPKKKGNFDATLLVTGSSGDGSVKVATVSLNGTGLGSK